MCPRAFRRSRTSPKRCETRPPTLVAPSLVTAPPITAPPRAPGLDATAEAPLAPVDPPPEPPPAVPLPDAPPAQPPIEPIARDLVAEREPPPPPPAWHRYAAMLAAMSVIAVTAFALRRTESPHTQPATPTRVTRDGAIDEVVFTVATPRPRARASRSMARTWASATRRCVVLAAGSATTCASKRPASRLTSTCCAPTPTSRSRCSSRPTRRALPPHATLRRPRDG